MEEREGIIYQSVAGFYYVWSEGDSYATRPKGLFRHTKEKPLVGDHVKFQVDPEDQESESRLVEILPRHNELLRPSISNVDEAIVVVSLVEPSFSYSLLDYFLVTAESHDIHSTIVLSKYDLLIEAQGQENADQLVQEIRSVYEPIGYQVLLANGTDDAATKVGNIIEAYTYVIVGQSGVGKSTLLNNLIPELDIETKEISSSLNRGRHTTREVTLYPYKEGLIADTPGFSAIEFPQIEKEDLRHYFPEILEYGHQCQFRSCMHINEPKCAVKTAVESGEIAKSRYETYRQIYEKIEQRKPKY